MTNSFAFVFPGQGSQSVGMLDAWGDHAVVRETLQEASDALGEDVARLIHEGSKETLALTTNTQPVMLVAGVAAYRVWMRETQRAPAFVAGHSLGEYSALVASGVLTLSQAAPLVRLRAQAMQEAVPVGVGAMAAIMGMSADKVRLGCEEVSAQFQKENPQSMEIVEAVNFNDPTQTVIAGSKAAVELACVKLKEQGAKRAISLPVSAPFHSRLMQPAAEKLKAKLETITLNAPQIPIINNVDVKIENNIERIKDALYRQAFHAVRWVECVQAIKVEGASTLIECGPGKVLAGLTKRIDSELQSAALFDPSSMNEVKTLLAI